MGFALLWIDFFLKEKLFGFGIGGVEKHNGFDKSLFSIYWNNGALLIDFFWFRILGR